jgi:hypothetical protein
MVIGAPIEVLSSACHLRRASSSRRRDRPRSGNHCFVGGGDANTVAATGETMQDDIRGHRFAVLLHERRLTKLYHSKTREQNQHCVIDDTRSDSQSQEGASRATVATGEANQLTTGNNR